MIVDELALQTGIDIPLMSARTSIHQPSIADIAHIGEDNFLNGCELLRFSKNKLSSKDRINLENLSDFEIIMSIMKNKQDVGAQKSATSAMLVLLLLFPNCSFKIQNEGIYIFNENTKQEAIIDKHCYNDFKDIIVSIFCFKDVEEKEMNPANDAARRIADKIRKGKEKAAAQKPQQEKVSLFSQYISILSVGERKDKNELSKYTVYQLKDEVKRFELKEQYDLYLKAKIAGATGMKEVDNWMSNIYDKKEK